MTRSFITDAERRRRRSAVDSSIGTHAMDGISTSDVVRALFDQYVEGNLSLPQLSARLDIEGMKAVEDTRAGRNSELPSAEPYGYIAYEGELKQITFPNGCVRWVPIDSSEPD